MTAWPTYTSERSVEVQTVVDASLLTDQGMVQERVVEALFNFVAIDMKGKSRPMPQLVVCFYFLHLIYTTHN